MPFWAMKNICIYLEVRVDSLWSTMSKLQAGIEDSSINTSVDLICVIPADPPGDGNACHRNANVSFSCRAKLSAQASSR